MPGYLGPHTADEWLEHAHGESITMCHTKRHGQQCAGFAIYRANVCKTTRYSDTLKLPPDREAVFASRDEFKTHHERFNK